MTKKREVLIGLLALLFVVNISAIAESKSFIRFGIAYVHPLKEDEYGDYTKLSKIFSDIGIRSTKINLVTWKQIERKAPVGGKHHYEWDKLDRVISLFQKEGYNHMEVVLQATSDWAGETLKTKKGSESSQLPQNKHLGDYASFVSNVVERYDGDGLNDMPGLRYPILHYEIESEAQGSAFFRGSADEYIQLLQIAYKAVKDANPRAIVILSGLWLGDVTHTKDTLEKRIAMIDEKKGFSKKNWGTYSNFFRKVLRQKDYFDLIEIHSLENHKMIYSAVGWLRKEMKKNGYEKPIIVGDATATPSLPFGPITPYSTPFSLDSREMIKILAAPRHKEYKTINNWYRAEQSREVVKKAVIAMELGLERINFGFFTDNLKLMGKPWRSKLFARLNPIGFNWAIAGFLDKNYRPYPAFYTYKLVIEKLKSAEFKRKLSLESDIHGFEFSSNGKPLYVLWSEEETVVDLSSIFEAPNVKLTRIITTRDPTKPKVEIKPSNSILLTPTPVFIEEN